MKVLMLSWEFPPLVEGGLGRHVAELAPELANSGVEVHILTHHAGPQLSEQLQPNLMLHRVNTANIQPAPDIFGRAEQVNELMDSFATTLWRDTGGFDLIHAHDWLVAFAAIELKLAFKCPLVATIHATERGRWRSHILPNELSSKIDRVERNLTFEAWRVIACSQYMVDELGRLFSLPIGKLDMIPNGINLATKPTFTPAELARFKVNYTSNGQPLIFSVGRLVYEKGYHIVIEAMAQVIAHIPGAKLILAGKGPLSDHLQTLAHDFGVTENIHFAGFISDEERDMFLATAGCAIFPSLYEPFGIVALEAMAFNCPVVASNVGGLAEVVTHNQTGTLIYPGNVNSAAWGILRVLQHPKQAHRLTGTAYQMVAQRYNWQRIAQQTRRVYNRVIVERAKTKW